MDREHLMLRALRVEGKEVYHCWVCRGGRKSPHVAAPTRSDLVGIRGTMAETRCSSRSR